MGSNPTLSAPDPIRTGAAHSAGTRWPRQTPRGASPPRRRCPCRACPRVALPAGGTARKPHCPPGRTATGRQRREARSKATIRRPRRSRLCPAPPRGRSAFGEVTERSKVHDWKSCVPKGTEGSNPSLSATSTLAYGPRRCLAPCPSARPVSAVCGIEAEDEYDSRVRATRGREPRQARKGAAVAFFLVCPVARLSSFSLRGAPCGAPGGVARRAPPVRSCPPHRSGSRP